MQCWQVLPLVPPDPEYYSPYSGLDTNCGNPLLIDLEALITEGLLEPSDRPATMPDGDVQFEQVATAKQPLLLKVAQTLLNAPNFAGKLACMCLLNETWRLTCCHRLAAAVQQTAAATWSGETQFMDSY